MIECRVKESEARVPVSAAGKYICLIKWLEMRPVKKAGLDREVTA